MSIINLGENTTEVFVKREDSGHKTETRGPTTRQKECTTQAHVSAAWCRPIWPSWPLSTSPFASHHIYEKSLTPEAQSFSQTRAPLPSKTRISVLDWSLSSLRRGGFCRLHHHRLHDDLHHHDFISHHDVWVILCRNMGWGELDEINNVIMYSSSIFQCLFWRYSCMIVIASLLCLMLVLGSK
jgi:hypothetical protein